MGGTWHKNANSCRLYCINGEWVAVPDGAGKKEPPRLLRSGGGEAKLLTVTFAYDKQWVAAPSHDAHGVELGPLPWHSHTPFLWVPPWTWFGDAERAPLSPVIFEMLAASRKWISWNRLLGRGSVVCFFLSSTMVRKAHLSSSGILHLWDMVTYTELKERRVVWWELTTHHNSFRRVVWCHWHWQHVTTLSGVSCGVIGTGNKSQLFQTYPTKS